MEQLEFIISGGETRRYHTWPVIRQQRVDEHSFHVAMLVSMMALDATPEDAEGLTVPLLMAALTHDLAEHRTGDLPAPVKRSFSNELRKEAGISGDFDFRRTWNNMEARLLQSQDLDWEHMLTPNQLKWLKLADAMQGALYCIRERQMGNRLIESVYNNFRSYIRELEDFNRMDYIASATAVPTMAQRIINYIDDTWEQANG